MDWRSHIARYGPGWFPGEPWVRSLALALLVMAAILRFWGLSHLPYTHDELSALMRIYPSLGETIERGVIELDTHPPGVQVFEWAWIQLFGDREAVVKFPFIVLSCAALFFFFRFGLACTSAGTALFSLALLATLQYTVLYAQIARPYAIGFFTVALLSDQLTRYLAWGERRSLVWTGIAAVLCAYVHHFSLLLAGFICLSGMILVTPQQRKAYWIMCMAAVVAYLPNIPIFLKQLGYGGLGGWLPPPGPDWLPRYASWVLHYSTPLMLVVGGLIGLSLVHRIRSGSTPGPLKWHLMLWGLAPLVIGMVYSIWRSPVLQYSMLIFSFPYLLFAAFSGSRTLSRSTITAGTIILAGVSTLTLVFGRRHQEVFRDSPYAAMVRVAEQLIRERGQDKVLLLFDAPRPQVEFHVRRSSLIDPGKIHWLRDQRGSIAVERLLSTDQFSTVVLGTTNGNWEERLAQVQARFPFTIALEDHVEGQVRVMSRQPDHELVQDRRLLTELSPGRRAGKVEVHDDLPMVHDRSTRTSAWDLSGREYGLGLSFDLNKVTYQPHDLFEAELLVTHADPSIELLVVLELHRADSTLFYRSTALQGAADTLYVNAALSPSWVGVSGGPLVLKAYIQNRSLSSVHVHRLRLFRREGDPIRDGLLAPVLELGHRPK